MAAVAVFSGLAVFLRPSGRRLVCFLFLAAGVVFSTLLFFSGVFAIVAGILFVFQYILIYVYYYNQKTFFADEPEKDSHNLWELIPAAAVCLMIGFLFYNYSFYPLSSYESVETITLMSYRELSREYFSSYFMLVILIAGSLFITVLWFILDIFNARR
ncbi:MAG: hypothetical protein ACQEP5_03835 [Actinomycetota bacterium]